MRSTNNIHLGDRCGRRKSPPPAYYGHHHMDIERHGFRSLEYSSWHRTASLKRYLGRDLASTILLTDVDHTLWIEHTGGERYPLLLIESALDTGQQYKPASVIQQLARRANVPAYVVLYTPAQRPNVGDARFADIERFRVKRLWPTLDTDWTTLTPGQWAERLLVLRARGAARLDEESRSQRTELTLVPPRAFTPGTQ